MPFDGRSGSAGRKTDPARGARDGDRGWPRGRGSHPRPPRAGSWRNARRTSSGRPACPYDSGISYDDNGNDLDRRYHPERPRTEEKGRLKAAAIESKRALDSGLLSEEIPKAVSTFSLSPQKPRWRDEHAKLKTALCL